MQARKEALSINCASINYTLFKAMPNVQQFLNIVNSWLVHTVLDKAVSKWVK